MALAVYRLAGGHFDPPFTDAVLLHVLAFVVVQADADFVLEHGGYVVGAARVHGQTVGQWWALWRVGHGVPWALESRALYRELSTRTCRSVRRKTDTRMRSRGCLTFDVS